MEGWEVVTADDEKIGRVVGEADGYLIVEHGHLIKSRHPLPTAFADRREEQRQVCVSVPKSMIQDAPKVQGTEFDRDAADRYYGLAAGMPGAPTEGYGDLEPDDPAWGPERDAEAAGTLPAEEQRARIRMGKHHERRPSSPGLLGGRRPRR
jgi:hypothetical protein